MTSKLDLKNIKKLLSQNQIDIGEPILVYATISQGVRGSVINELAKICGIDLGDLTHRELTQELNKEGDVFPIILLEVIDPLAKHRNKYIFPCGKMTSSQSENMPTPFSWSQIVNEFKEDSINLYKYTNTIVKDIPFTLGHLEKECVDTIQSIISDLNDVQYFVCSIALDEITVEIKDDPSETHSEQQETKEKLQEDTTEHAQEETKPDDSESDEDNFDDAREHRINSLSSNQKFRLPKFKEHDNCEAWVKKADFILTLGGITADKKKISNMCSHLPDAIQDTVILELAELNEAMYTLTEFTKVLNRACKKNDIQYGVLLKKLKFNPDTHLNLRNFYYRINQLVKQTIGGESKEMLEKISFKEFLEKLPYKVQSSEMLLEYRKDKDKTTMDLVDKCSELYDSYKAGSHSEINQITRTKGFKKKNMSLNNYNKKTVTCYYCNKTGHVKPECRKMKADQLQKRGNVAPGKKIVCHSCNKPGHKSFECRSNITQKPSQKQSFAYNAKGKGRRDDCRYCKKPGHYEKDCFKKKRDQNGRRESNFKRKQ